MTKKLLLVLVCGLLPAVLACPAHAAGAAGAVATNSSEVVARVGGADLTADDLRAYLGTLPQADQAALVADPAKLSQMVRLYLAQRLVVKEAKDRKFDQQAEVQLDRIRDAALAQLYLASVAKVPDGYPSDAEVQAAYDANKTAFLLPRQYHLAQIFVAAAKGDKAAEDKGKAKLDAVTAKLKERGADFGAAAAQFSDIKAEAEKGGEIGWVAESQLMPEIRDKVSGLPKDGITDPVLGQDGWHIVKLLDTKAAGTAPLSDIKPALIERLRQARAQQLQQAYLGQLLQKDPPVINEIALSKITAKK